MNFPKCFAYVLTVGMTAQAVASTTTVGKLYTRTDSVDWVTAHESTMNIPLTFPAGATTCRLTIDGRHGRVVNQSVASGTASYAWTLFNGAVPSEDDAFTLVASYRDGSDAELLAVTGHVVVATGAFPAADLKLDRTKRSWTRANDLFLIPYSDTWRSVLDKGQPIDLEIDGAHSLSVPTLTGEGWFPWWLDTTTWPRGSYDLTLDCGGNHLEAILRHAFIGLSISVR